MQSQITLKFQTAIIISVLVSFTSAEYKQNRSKRDLKEILTILDYINIIRPVTISKRESDNKFKVCVDPHIRYTDINYRILANGTRYVKQIVFLRVHKAGSTTVRTIFSKILNEDRNRHNMPRYIHYFFGGYPALFNSSHTTEDALDNSFISSHLRWNLPELNKFYKGREFFKIGIIRNPLSQWISSYNFYYYAKYYNRVGGGISCLGMPYVNKTDYKRVEIDDFVKTKIQDRYDLSNVAFGFRALNAMSYDYGLDNVKTLTDNEIQERIDEFDFIIVLERLAESLILLKNLMCLDLSSVYLSHSTNCGSSSNNNKCELKLKTTLNEDLVVYDRPDTSKYNISSESITKLENEFMFNDIKLYNMIGKKFTGWISQFGHDNMKRGLKEYDNYGEYTNQRERRTLGQDIDNMSKVDLVKLYDVLNYMQGPDKIHKCRGTNDMLQETEQNM